MCQEPARAHATVLLYRTFLLREVTHLGRYQPFADEVVNDSGDQYSPISTCRTGGADAEEISRRLEAFDHGSALQIVNHHRDSYGANLLLGELARTELVRLSARTMPTNHPTVIDLGTINWSIFTPP